MKKRKPGPGRPKADPENTKSHPVQIRMGGTEKEAFSLAAQLAGLSLSAWMRERLRASARLELQKAGKPVAFLD